MVNGLRVVPEAEAAQRWDEWLGAFEDRGIRQSHAWSRHKTGGWTPLRLALFENGTPAAMALFLTRRAPLGVVSVAWANAGPVFRRGRGARDLASLRTFLDGVTAHFRGVPRAVVRLAPRVPSEPALEAALEAAGFKPARSPLDSGQTVVWDLRRGVDELRAGLDRKWRNQLKKAEAAAPRFEFGRDRALLERALRLHEQTRKRKSLKDGVDLAALERAAGDFGPALTFAVGSVRGRDGCALSWWSFSGRATLWLSASSAEGQALCLPNAAYWAVMLRLREDGAASFDLSGIDERRNPGVTHFKRGTGGGEVLTPGEWDWSAAAFPRAAFNAVLGAVRARLPR